MVVRSSELSDMACCQVVLRDSNRTRVMVSRIAFGPGIALTERMIGPRWEIPFIGIRSTFGIRPARS